MQKVNDESKLELITTLLARIDDDHDGQIKVDDVLKVMMAKYDMIHPNN